MGPAHSGQTRMLLPVCGLGAWYRVGRSWGLGTGDMGTSGSGGATTLTRRYTENRESQETRNGSALPLLAGVGGRTGRGSLKLGPAGPTEWRYARDWARPYPGVGKDSSDVQESLHRGADHDGSAQSDA